MNISDLRCGQIISIRLDNEVFEGVISEVDYASSAATVSGKKIGFGQIIDYSLISRAELSPWLEILYQAMACGNEVRIRHGNGLFAYQVNTISRDNVRATSFVKDAKLRSVPRPTEVIRFSDIRTVEPVSWEPKIVTAS